MQTVNKGYTLKPLVSEDFSKLFRTLAYGVLEKINEPLNFSNYAGDVNSKAEVTYTRNQSRAFLNQVIKGVYETLTELKEDKNIEEILNEAVNKINKLVEKDEKLGASNGLNEHVSVEEGEDSVQIDISKEELASLLSSYKSCVFGPSSKGKIKMLKGGENIDIEILHPYKFLNNAGKKAILEETKLRNMELIKGNLTDRKIKYILGADGIEADETGDAKFNREKGNYVGLRNLFKSSSTEPDLIARINKIKQFSLGIIGKIKNENDKKLAIALVTLYIAEITEAKMDSNEASESDLQKILLSEDEKFKFFDIWGNNASTKGLLYDIWTQIDGLTRNPEFNPSDKSIGNHSPERRLADKIVGNDIQTVKNLVTAHGGKTFNNIIIDKNQEDAKYPCLIIRFNDIKDRVVNSNCDSVYNLLLEIPNALQELSKEKNSTHEVVVKFLEIQFKSLFKIFNKKPPLSVETLVSIFSEAFGLKLDSIFNNFPQDENLRNLFMVELVNKLSALLKEKGGENLSLSGIAKECLEKFSNAEFENVLYRDRVQEIRGSWDKLSKVPAGKLFDALTSKVPGKCKKEFEDFLSKRPHTSNWIDYAKQFPFETFKESLCREQKSKIKSIANKSISKNTICEKLKNNSVVGDIRYEQAYLEFLNHLMAASINQHLYEKGIGGYFDRRQSFGFLTPTVTDVGTGLRLSLGLVPGKNWLDAVMEGIKDFDQYLGILVEKLPLYSEILDGFHGEFSAVLGKDYGSLTGVAHFLMLSALDNKSESSSSRIDYQSNLEKMLDKLDNAMKIKRKGSSIEQEAFENEKKAFEKKLKDHNYLKSEDEAFNSLFKEVHRVYELAITNLEGKIKKESKELEKKKREFKSEDLSLSINNENELPPPNKRKLKR